MLTIVAPTVEAAARHATDGLWLMFVQSVDPASVYGPIAVEELHGQNIADRLLELQKHNPYELRMIGLMPVENIGIDYIRATFSGCAMHDAWFEPCDELITFIVEHAQDAITALLAQTHPGALSDAPVDIEEIARIIGVSVPTVRRMVKGREIPFLKWGRIYRFVPADVIASLRNR